jgi:hypothetical protein
MENANISRSRYGGSASSVLAVAELSIGYDMAFTFVFQEGCAWRVKLRD